MAQQQVVEHHQSKNAAKLQRQLGVYQGLPEEAL